MNGKANKEKYFKNKTKAWQEMLNEWKELSELEKNVLSIDLNEKDNNNNKEEGEGEREREEKKKEDKECREKIKLTQEDVDNIKRLLRERSTINKKNGCCKIINQNKAKCFNEKAIYEEYKNFCEIEKKQLSNLLDIMRNSNKLTTTTPPNYGDFIEISNQHTNYLQEKFTEVLKNKASTSTNFTYYSLRLLSALEAYKKLEFVDENLEQIISFIKENF